MINLERFSSLMYQYQQLIPFGCPNFAHKPVLEFWYENLQNYDLKDLMNAMRHFALSHERFPSLKQIKDRLEGKITDRHECMAISGKIIGAISRFGWNHPDRAKEFIGEIGWYVVQILGGWLYLCEVIDNRNLTTYQAQIRDMARNAIDKHNRGHLQLTTNVKEVLKIEDKSPLQKALEIIDGKE